MQGFDNEFLFRYLKRAKVPYIKKEVEEVLLNHPNTPSLKSVSDTLEELNIRTMAVGLETTDLDELDYPVMAHLKQGHGEFVLLESKNQDHVTYFHHGKSQEEALETFEKKWSGNTLLLEAPKKRSVENARSYYWKKYGGALLSLIGALIIGTLVFLGLEEGSPALVTQVLSLLALNLAGLVLSVYLYRLHLHKSARKDKYCKKTKNTDCAAVLSSKWATLFGYFNWAQLGVLYFSGQLLALLLGLVGFSTIQSSISLLSILTLVAGGFSLYSIILQAFVIKKWCVLCLLTQVTVLGSVAMNHLYGMPWEMTFDSGSGITVLLSFFGAFILTKQYSDREEEKIHFESKTMQLAKFKGDPDIFQHVLRKQRTMHNTRPLEGTVLIGHEAAPNELLMAASLHCGPCARMFSELTALVKKYPDKLKLRILFTLPTGFGPEELPVNARIINLAMTDKESTVIEALTAWYEQLGRKDGESLWLNEYRPKRELTKVELTQYFDSHQLWLSQTMIYKTPTLFFNYHELPQVYAEQESLKHFL